MLGMELERKNHKHLVEEKTAIKLFTSGLRIINCIQINDPNEKPDTQHWL